MRSNFEGARSRVINNNKQKCKGHCVPILRENNSWQQQKRKEKKKEKKRKYERY
jgi:hypothetical protein